MLEVGILYVDKFPAADPSPNAEVMLRMEAIDPRDGVLYAYELTDDWTPINAMLALRLDGVLTISVTARRGNRRGLAARMWSRQNNDIVAARDKPWWGEDSYAIGVMPDGRFFTTQWAETDVSLFCRHIADGGHAGNIDFPRTWPNGSVVTIFDGAYLPPPLWTQALAVFEARMF